MSDAEPDTLLLAPETEALIEALLRRQGAQRPAPPPPLRTTDLVRYLCHALPSPEARQIEQGLTANPVSRRNLREVRRQLDRLQDLSWSEVADASQGDTLEAEVAQAWLTLAAQPLQEIAPDAAGAPATFGEALWTTIKRRAEAGIAQARGLWTALHAFGSQAHIQSQQALPALMRGSSDRLPVQGAWQGECHLLAAEIAADGALHVSAMLTDLSGAPAVGFAGQTAYLALRAGGELLLCGAATLEEEKISWIVTEVGPIVGQPPAKFPARGLAILVAQPDFPLQPLPSLRRFSSDLLTQGFLVAGVEPLPETSEVIGWLAANILTAQGRESNREPMSVEIVGSPYAAKGHLQIAVRLPTRTQAAYATDYRLLLDLAVAPGEWQRLGDWPLKDWGETTQALSIACPGLADGVFASLTLIRARLVPLGAGSPAAP